jgi:hypothetical protein
MKKVITGKIPGWRIVYAENGVHVLEVLRKDALGGDAWSENKFKEIGYPMDLDIAQEVVGRAFGAATYVAVCDDPGGDVMYVDENGRPLRDNMKSIVEKLAYFRVEK